MLSFNSNQGNASGLLVKSYNFALQMQVYHQQNFLCSSLPCTFPLPSCFRKIPTHVWGYCFLHSRFKQQLFFSPTALLPVILEVGQVSCLLLTGISGSSPSHLLKLLRFEGHAITLYHLLPLLVAALTDFQVTSPYSLKI